MSQVHESHHADQGHGGHGHDSHEAGHEHPHGYNSFLDRWWKPIVIGIGCIGVFILSHYNPVGN